MMSIKKRIRKTAIIMGVFSQIMMMTACGAVYRNLNERAGASLESSRDNFIVYCAGSTEEIADQIMQTVIDCIAAKDHKRFQNLFASFNPMRVRKSDADRLFASVPETFDSMELLQADHYFRRPEDDDRRETTPNGRGYYYYRIDAMYRLTSGDLSYICYFEATRMDGYQTSMQGLNRICMIPEEDYRADGEYTFIPDYGGGELVSTLDDERKMQENDDRIARIGIPQSNLPDTISPEVYLRDTSTEYDYDEAYDAAGFVLGAVNEGDPEKLLRLFSQKARRAANCSVEKAEEMIDLLGHVASYRGGVIYLFNFGHMKNDTGFSGENFMVTSRFLCETENGVFLMSIRLFDKYDDDEDGYLGIWSIEIEEREDDSFRIFQSVHPRREAGIILYETE